MSFDSEAHYENIQDRKRIVELQSQLALAREGLRLIAYYHKGTKTAEQIAEETLAKLSETK